MCGGDDLHDSGPVRRPRCLALSGTLALSMGLALLLAACGSSNPGTQGLAEPTASVTPKPDYADVCAPVGADTTATCLRITLGAIDAARAAEGLRPMLLPADFAHLTVPEQLFVALDRERVDRGLAPFTGLVASLDSDAQRGARAAQLPARPGSDFSSTATEWIGEIDNGLDADFQWVYDDGPDSGVFDCSRGQDSGCWADRKIVLGRFPAPSGHLVMGAAYDPTADTSPGDLGGSSLAAALAVDTARRPVYVYTWKQALAAMSGGPLRPLRSIPAAESVTGIPDPADNVAAVPDYTRDCADTGLDDSAACTGAALAAINHAHALEGVHPMVLPVGFTALTMPEQLFVAIDLERVDRGLPPFVGLTADLDANAQRGADDANDPPDPGRAYDLDDSEWAGGSSNALDAVYGWMYDDGFDSGNLDCTHRGAAGCWGHRKGILDDFGSGADLVMGAAVDDSGDTHAGDAGGTSMAVTLAVAGAPVRAYLFTWAQVVAALSPGAL